MNAPFGEQIEIAVGDQQAVVVEVGGGLRSYSAGSRKLVDGYRADEMSSSGRGQVLIPWPNRLQDGRYEFEQPGAFFRFLRCAPTGETYVCNGCCCRLPLCRASRHQI